MKSRRNKSQKADWNSFYKKRIIPWQSNGLSPVTSRYLKKYAETGTLLEIGCGSGEETRAIIDAGFTYQGFDISKEAIRLARRNNPTHAKAFFVSDFLTLPGSKKYSVLYDKGVFHNSPGERSREKFVRQAASLLKKDGIWVTVCGSADRYDPQIPHGAVFLQHLIAPVEPCFEILEIVKAPYGTQNDTFDGWYCAFRRR